MLEYTSERMCFFIVLRGQKNQKFIVIKKVDKDNKSVWYLFSIRLKCENLRYYWKKFK